MFTNYQFELSQAHKNFKESNDESIKLRQLEILNETADRGLIKLVEALSERIGNYFEKTRYSKRRPRVGIHIINEQGNYENLLDKEDQKAKKISEYTIFEQIKKLGIPYLDHNIPRTIKETKTPYSHNGINLNSVKTNYKLKILDRKMVKRLYRARDSYPDQDASWNSMCINGEFHELYKTHLGIPVTFRKHAKSNLNKDLIKLLDLPDDGRSILAILVIDHPDIFYFDDTDPHGMENLDVNVMYSFADLISLGIVSKLTYTKGSNSVRNFNGEKDEKSSTRPTT